MTQHHCMASFYLYKSLHGEKDGSSHEETAASNIWGGFHRPGKVSAVYPIDAPKTLPAQKHGSSPIHVNHNGIHLQNPRSCPLWDSIAKLRPKDIKWTHHNRNGDERGKNSTFFSLWGCVAMWIYTYSHKKKGGVCLRTSQDFFLQYYKWCGKYPLQHDQRYGSDEHRKLLRVEANSVPFLLWLYLHKFVTFF